MQIILHTGAHFTEELRVSRCLVRNKEGFGRRGIAVPGPSRYRRLLKDAMEALADADPAPGARDVILDEILDEEHTDRMVLSHPFYFGAPHSCLRNGLLYHLAPERMAKTAALFAEDDVHLYFAIRNPATFLPLMFDKAPHDNQQRFFGAAHPADIRWSDLFLAIRDAAPTVQMTVWCNEDAPLIWAQIIRDMAGLEDGEKIVGGFDLLSDIMSAEGMKRFRAYLKSHPVMTEAQKRRVIAAFLDKFAIEDELEEEINMPGWSDEMVDDLTEAYDEDIARIEAVPGLRMILP